MNDNKLLMAVSFMALTLSFAGLILPQTESIELEISDTLLFFDNFEAETMKWLGVGSGLVTRTTEQAFNGEASMNVTALTWDLEESLKQIGSYDYPLPEITLDFWFALPSTNFNYFVFGLEYCSAHRDTWERSGIKLISGQYENDTGVWTDIPDFISGLDLNDGYDIWHHAVLTVDLANGNYIELILDDYTVNMQSLGFECYDRGDTEPFWGIMYPYFYSGCGSGIHQDILIDDVTLYYTEIME